MDIFTTETLKSTESASDMHCSFTSRYRPHDVDEYANPAFVDQVPEPTYDNIPDYDGWVSSQPFSALKFV